MITITKLSLLTIVTMGLLLTGTSAFAQQPNNIPQNNLKGTVDEHEVRITQNESDIDALQSFEQWANDAISQLQGSINSVFAKLSEPNVFTSQNQFITDSGEAILAETSDDSGSVSAILARTTNTDDFNIGGNFRSAGIDGIGVLGMSEHEHSGTGVHGLALGGNEGKGVRGDGSAYGVFGFTSTGIAGIEGRHVGTEGETYGVVGEVFSPDGFGLYTKDNAKVEGNLVVGQNIECEDCVDSSNIDDDSITFDHISQNGCSTDQIMKWDGSQWICADTVTEETKTIRIAGTNLVPLQMVGDLKAIYDVNGGIRFSGDGVTSNPRGMGQIHGIPDGALITDFKCKMRDNSVSAYSNCAIYRTTTFTTHVHEISTGISETPGIDVFTTNSLTPFQHNTNDMLFLSYTTGHICGYDCVFYDAEITYIENPN